MNPDGSERYTTPLGMPVNIVRMTIELNQMSRGEREKEREKRRGTIPIVVVIDTQ